MKTRSWLAILVVAGILIRIALWACSEPLSYPDTGTYLSAAKDLTEGGLSRSEGRRTPGYPLVVALAQGQPARIVAFQMVAGILTSVLLFYIALQLTRRPGFAFLAGMTYNLNLQQLFMETALMSESISTLSVTAVLAISIPVSRRCRNGRPVRALLVSLGLVAGAAILVRPQFVFLPLLLVAVVAYASRHSRDRALRVIVNASLVGAPSLMIVVAWAAFVFAHTGYFALTTQTGFSLVNHSVAFVELAPDRYATIRDILLKYRDIQHARLGNYGNTGWLAWPEIRAATGMTIPAASRELQSMSNDLFLSHPVRYARSVALSWIDFWTVPIFWDPGKIVPQEAASALRAIWWVEHKLLRGFNLAMVALVAIVLVSHRARVVSRWDLDMTNISALVLLSSAVQALADYGASSRYLVTTQSLVVLVVLTAFHHAAMSGRPQGTRQMN